MPCPHVTSSQYSGSLLAKRKGELVEIAQALHIPEPEVKIIELIRKIHEHLDSHESSLSNDPSFKGLYVRHRNR